MNGVRVKTREIINGNCYTTRNRKEEFCFRQNEQYRFSGALADTTKAGGIWITEDTTCTNKLHPFDGSIAVVENSFHEKQPSIYLWYDDIGKAERLGIEADSCQIFDIKKTGSGTFNGKLHCGGEGIEHADNDEIDRSKGSVIIKVKPNEELLLFKHGEKERYVQCQG